MHIRSIVAAALVACSLAGMLVIVAPPEALADRTCWTYPNEGVARCIDIDEEGTTCTTSGSTRFSSTTCRTTPRREQEFTVSLCGYFPGEEPGGITEQLGRISDPQRLYRPKRVAEQMGLQWSCGADGSSDPRADLPSVRVDPCEYQTPTGVRYDCR